MKVPTIYISHFSPYCPLHALLNRSRAWVATGVVRMDGYLEKAWRCSLSCQKSASATDNL